MNEITSQVPFEYWNKLANQVITISSLLGGFSIAIIANILVSKNDTKLVEKILIVSTLAASFFLITIFAMTKLLLMTTVGYPFEFVPEELKFPRFLGSITFFLGILSLVFMISMSGWTKSKKIGWFTTLIGFITFIIILMMTS